MVAFGDVGCRIVGKPVQQLLRTSTSATAYPADITKLVSLRFTFAVTLTEQSFYRAQKTYNVAVLVTAYGHQVVAPNNAPNINPSSEHLDHSGSVESGGSSAKNEAETTRELSPTVTQVGFLTLFPRFPCVMLTTF